VTSSAGTRTNRDGPVSDPVGRRASETLQGKVPAGAVFEHIAADYGDRSPCDGCNAPIDDDELEYQLQFRRGAQSITVRLHIDCWESWRAERLHDTSMPGEGFRSTSAQRVYLCTRHDDGRVICNVQPELEVALSALRTFLGTARYFGYQIDTAESPEKQYAHFARNTRGSLVFWISDKDESTLGWAELAL
jgi:hypothetical protein